MGENNWLECPPIFAVPIHSKRLLARVKTLCYTNIPLILANSDLLA